MRLPIPFLILLAVGAHGFAQDAAPPADSKPAVEKPAAVQQQSVAAMQPSLTAQRASIASQVGDHSSGSFFLLGPPSESGLVPVTASVTASEGDCDPLPASQLDPLIESAAKQEDLQPELLRSMISQESGARPCAVSPKGAMGLMQLMPGTAAQLGVKDPFDPKENLNAGAWFVKQLLTTYNDLPLALGAYNAGPARVNAIDGIPAIPETQDYIRRIMSTLPPKK
jgi:soluble lytic murein transglycosylase-like protein